MTTARVTQFAKGYQAALADVASQLREGGAEAVAEWLRSNLHGRDAESAELVVWLRNANTQATEKPEPATVSVACIGPNLRGGGATFHVHAAHCADRKRPIYRFHKDDWNNPLTISSEQDLVEYVFEDIIREHEDENDDWTRYTDEFKWFPCVKGIELS